MEDREPIFILLQKSISLFQKNIMYPLTFIPLLPMAQRNSMILDTKIMEFLRTI